MSAVDFYLGIKWEHPPVPSTVRPPDLPDQFLRRLQGSYRLQTETIDFGSSFWKQFAAKNAANPAATNMFWGFDAIAADAVEPYLENPENVRPSHVEAICDRILRLGVAIGALRLEYPEALQDVPTLLDIEPALDAIENKFGRPLTFPNPFPNEIGVATSRGIISYRPLQAIYQAYRVRQLTKTYGDRVVEIGGGLGRTAYYAWRLGICDYTLIDIPISATAQAIFLIPWAPMPSRYPASATEKGPCASNPRAGSIQRKNRSMSH